MDRTFLQHEFDVATGHDGEFLAPRKIFHDLGYIVQGPRATRQFGRTAYSSMHFGNNQALVFDGDAFVYFKKYLWF